METFLWEPCHVVTLKFFLRSPCCLLPCESWVEGTGEALSNVIRLGLDFPSNRTSDGVKFTSQPPSPLFCSLWNPNLSRTEQTNKCPENLILVACRKHRESCVVCCSQSTIHNHSLTVEALIELTCLHAYWLEGILKAFRQGPISYKKFQNCCICILLKWLALYWNTWHEWEEFRKDFA